ncbi:MAG: peptidoglycan DD-metalloendopeptidase family protein [Lachnospiraceae bacterium]|nr:peptidoglycan DD-metalloendopeptidase family protein [Lachnospiraceae bacterium]
MKKKRYIHVLLLAVLLAAAMHYSNRGAVMASEAEISTGGSSEESSEKKDTEEKKTTGSGNKKIDTDELEKKKKDALDKINDIKSDISDIKKNIERLEANKSNLKDYIARLDQEAASLAGQIKKLNEDIEAKKEEIVQAEAELDEAQRVADQQYEDMKLRIQYLYENGNPSYLEMLLTADSIGDFLNKSTYVKAMSEYDRKKMDEYIAQKEAVAAAKAVLESEEEELELMADAAKEQKETVDALIKKKTAEIQSYQAQIDSQNSDAAEFKEDLEEQEKLLNQIEEQIAAAALANASMDDGDGGASGFVWPCPSSRRITSGFGPRPQPLPGASTNHKGIDIGAAHGSSIVAAAGGRVTTSTYSSSAGNYVVISHGNGLSTVYMHCSALYVSVGDVVSAGQSIAAVGSTGFSTGPHLHFGVIKNGTYVNPRNYVG